MRKMVLMLAIALPALSLANDKEKAASWITSASQLSNLEGHDRKPFRLHLQWKSGYGSVVASGTYQLLWTNANEWKEELRSGDVVAVRASRGGHAWTLRGDDFLSYPAYQIENMLDILWRLGLDDLGQAKDLFNQKIEGAEAHCAAFERKDSMVTRVCFAANGTLLGMARPVSVNSMMDAERTGYSNGRMTGPMLASYNTYNFNQYAPFGDMLFPRHMLAMSQNLPTLEAMVDDIQPMQPQDPAATPPEGAVSTSVCPVDEQSIGRETRLSSIPSQFGAALARFIRYGGSARIYVVVTTDGTIRNANLIMSDAQPTGQSAEFGNIAMQIVRTMKYKPYLCSGVPQAFGTEEELILRGRSGP